MPRNDLNSLLEHWREKMRKKTLLLPLSLLITMAFSFTLFANAKSLQQIQQENQMAATNSTKNQQAFQQRLQQYQQEYLTSQQETKMNMNTTTSGTITSSPSITPSQTTTPQTTYTPPPPTESTPSTSDSFTGFSDSDNNQQQTNDDNGWQYGF